MIRIARTATAAASLAAAAGAVMVGFGAGHAAAQPATCAMNQTYVNSVTTTDAKGIICQSQTDGSLTYVGINRNDGSTVTINNVDAQSAAGLSDYTATAPDGTRYHVLPDNELTIYSPSGATIFDEPQIS